MVGDRGLSGGERQRVGIARALYHDPSFGLDEAISLDNETERLIVDSILKLSPAKTILAVAHRLSTVQDCDVVYLMVKAGLSIVGWFGELRRAIRTLFHLFDDQVSAR
ncbi:MAG: hypothetical protein R2862_01020 [Thermoanaerobaculia bacterium]